MLFINQKLFIPPNGRIEKKKYGEYLKSTEKHIENENQL